MLTMLPGVPCGEVTPPELAGDEERPVQRDVHDGAPGVRRHLVGRNREVGRSVVDQHAGQAKCLLGRVERGCDRLRIANVALRRDHGAAERLDRSHAAGEVLVGPRCDDDRGAEPGELGGDRLAQASASARDEHSHTVERARAQCRLADCRR